MVQIPHFVLSFMSLELKPLIRYWYYKDYQLGYVEEVQNKTKMKKNSK